MKIKQAPVPKVAEHHARERHASTMRGISPFTRGKYDVGVAPARVIRQSKHRAEYNISHTRPRHSLIRNYMGDT